jgi:hypothetical protein
VETGYLGLQELKDQWASFREHSGQEQTHPSSFRQKHHEKNGQGALPGSNYLREPREGPVPPEQASEARSNHQWASPSSPE